MAKVYKVMIASPNDVVHERNIIREVIYEWNAVNSDSRNTVLLPVAWETHSSPEMGEKPQKIINRQILANCDLLVGVFWTKLGTETGEYASGTVEEIERHIAAGKPAMLYFSNKPVHPDIVDPKQYGRLKEFKISCQNRGLYGNYSDLNDFKEKFYRQLQLRMNQSEYINIKLSQDELPKLDDSKTQRIPSLSHEAKILLKEGSEDSHGEIICIRYSGGIEIRTNGRNLVTEKTIKEFAKWEGAINELQSYDLIVDRGYKGEVFAVTREGFELAETID